MAKSERIIAIRLKVDSKPELVNGLENSLESLQKEVGGLIEAFVIRRTPHSTITLWLNEEGRLEGLPRNMLIARRSDGEVVTDIVGDCVITATDSQNENISLTAEEINWVISSFVPDLMGQRVFIV